MTPAYYVCRALHARLLEIIDQEDTDPAVAAETEVLRDYMDPLWWQMTDEEKGLFQRE